MIKLLYKPTGNVFTLPDQEALNIKKDDRGNDYIILEGGLQQREEKTINQKEVKQIEELKLSEQTFEQNVKFEPSDKPKKAYSRPRKQYDASDLTKLSKQELVIMADKLGIRNMENEKVEDIIKYIQGDKKKVLKKPGSGKTRKV